MNWIDINHDQPEKAGYYLTLAIYKEDCELDPQLDIKAEVKFYRKATQYTKHEGWQCTSRKVTHWIPIPPSPYKEGNKRYIYDL